MKPHLPTLLLRAVLAAVLLTPGALVSVQAQTPVTPDNFSYVDAQVYLEGDISIPTQELYYFANSVTEFNGNGYTITFVPPTTADDIKGTFYFDSDSEAETPNTVSIKNVTFDEAEIRLYTNVYNFEEVTFSGHSAMTFYDATFSMEGITNKGTLELVLNNATVVKGGVNLTPDLILSIFHSQQEENSTIHVPTIEGDLVLLGGQLGFGSLGPSLFGSGYLNQHLLTVTGTLRINSATKIFFSPYSTSDGSTVLPEENQACIWCQDFSGDLTQITPFLYSDSNDIYQDGVLLEGMRFSSSASGNGYTIYLAADSGSSTPDDPAPIPPAVDIIENGSVPETGSLGKDYEIVMSNNSQVDASGSTETTLDGSYISGAGTLITSNTQTIVITGNQELTYSVSGTDNTTPGASVEFGTDGGSLTSQMSSIAGAAGQTLNLQRMSVKSGIVDNKSTVTSAEVISVGSNSGSAALNNYGTLSAGQGILVNSTSSMDNRGIINGDITVTTGATVANNSTVQGHITVAEGGLLKGTGTATAATVSGTLNVGNSPGFQRYESLTLNNGSQLIFTVDGSTPATLTNYGEGTYSQINVTTPGGLTVNGTPTAQVVFTSNAVLGALQSGSMTLPLTLITVNNGEGKPVDATTSAGITYSVGGELANFITLDASSGTLVADLNSAAVLVGMGGSARDLANTLWSSTMVVNSFARQASAQISPARRLSTGEQKDGMAVWGAGLGDFTNVGGADGFTYSGGGYAVGVDGTLNGNLRGGIAFGQQWGTFKSDARGTKVDQDSTMVGLYGGYSGSSDKLDYQITGYAAYGTTDNDSRTSMGGVSSGRGDWDSDTATWGLKGEMAYRYSDRASIGAFIGLDYLYGSMGSFTELYDAGLYRRVSDGAMQVWRMPIGITWKGEYSLGGSQYLLPAISLAYVGDISRTNPHVSTETLGMQERAKGSNIGRNAFLLNAGATWLISDQWSASAAYNLEVRSGQTAQSINAGVRYAF